MTVLEGPSTDSHQKWLSGDKVGALDHKQATDILDSLWLLERLVNSLTLYLVFGGTEELFVLKHKDPSILGPDGSDFLEKRCPCISKEVGFSIEQPFIFKKVGGVFISFLF